MNIAIVLTHNKGDKANSQQVDTLKTLLQEVLVPLFNTKTNDKGESVEVPILDEQGIQKQGFSHYILTDLPLPHTVKVYQIIPFGVIPPPNRYEVNSGGLVYYGKGDEDKVGDHPRFWNWGLKRGTDGGGEVVVQIEDMKKFDVDDLAVELNSLIDPEDPHELVEDPSSKIASLKLLKEVGLIDENKSKEEGIAELKNKVVEKGLKVF